MEEPDLVDSKIFAETVWAVIGLSKVADLAAVVDAADGFAAVEVFVVHVVVGLWSDWPNNGLQNQASFGCVA